MNRRVLTLAAVALVGGCAMKSDVTRVQNDVALLREESARQDSARAPRVEARNGDAASTTDLARENPRDEEPRDDKEDVDTYEASGEPVDLRVAQHDQQNRNGTHTLDVPTLTGGGTGRARRFPRMLAWR